MYLLKFNFLDKNPNHFWTKKVYSKRELKEFKASIMPYVGTLRVTPI
jgi:hypothetical protein